MPSGMNHHTHTHTQTALRCNFFFFCHWYRTQVDKTLAECILGTWLLFFGMQSERLFKRKQKSMEGSRY